MLAQKPAPKTRASGAKAQAAKAQGTPGPRTILFSAMKNEAPFLLEWIAYHKVIGFDEIVICSNPSNDGTEDLLAALAAQGEVRHLRATVGPDEGALKVASVTFAREVGFQDGNWYLWLDSDEFLNVHAGDRTVGALLQVMGERHFAPISWRVFGSGGNDRFGGRLIDPAFTGASEPAFVSNLEQKTLFRHSSAVRGFGHFGTNRPALNRGSGMTSADVMVGNGGPALDAPRANQRWLGGADFGKSAWVAPEEFGWVHAQINHYVVRTPEFYRLKRLRGRGYSANPDNNGLQRYTDGFFNDHDRNECRDNSILHWQHKVTDEIARLRSNPEVARMAERSAALVAALLGEAEESQPSPMQGGPFPLVLPPSEAEFLRDAYDRAEVILEYGSGGSTMLAAGLGKLLFSVESDKAWAESLAGELAAKRNAHIHYVDIGPTGKWGMPVAAKPNPAFHRYALSVWDRPDFRQPDVVFIDGRFRAACVAATMLRTTRPLTVLLDDYVNRRRYHRVEKIATLDRMVGRMAVFTVTPGPIPPDLLTEVIGWFSDPR